MEQCADGSSHRCDTSTLLQVLQCIHTDIDLVLLRITIQDVTDLSSIIAACSELRRKDRGLTLYDRYTTIVRHEYTSFVLFILSQHHRRLCGAGQSRAQRHMHDLITGLEELIPDLHHILHARLRCRDVMIILQLFEELFSCKVDVFVIFLIIDPERHRNDTDAELCTLLWCDTTTGIS